MGRLRLSSRTVADPARAMSPATGPKAPIEPDPAPEPPPMIDV
jgi:hypothetical protein